MYKSLMKKAAIALTLVSAAAVQAATFNIGALGNTYTNTVDVQGTFDDTYTFSLPGSFSGVTGGYLGFDFDGSGMNTFLTVGQGTPGAGLMVSLPHGPGGRRRGFIPIYFQSHTRRLLLVQTVW